MKLKLVELSWW